ncbi:hypothetical protein [Streptomyces sp. NRRL S-481]|nr:hypothetical protein [Streptomyces sp. NRRL S-481]
MEITALITAYAMLIALLIVAKLVSYILGSGGDGEARRQRDKKRRR